MTSPAEAEAEGPLSDAVGPGPEVCTAGGVDDGDDGEDGEDEDDGDPDGDGDAGCAAHAAKHPADARSPIAMSLCVRIYAPVDDAD